MLHHYIAAELGFVSCVSEIGNVISFSSENRKFATLHEEIETKLKGVHFIVHFLLSTILHSGINQIMNELLRHANAHIKQPNTLM